MENTEQNLQWSQTMSGTPWQKWSSAILYLSSIALGNIFVIYFGIGTLTLANAFDPEKIYFSLTFPLGALWIDIQFSRLCTALLVSPKMLDLDDYCRNYYLFLE